MSTIRTILLSLVAAALAFANTPFFQQRLCRRAVLADLQKAALVSSLESEKAATPVPPSTQSLPPPDSTTSAESRRRAKAGYPPQIMSLEVIKERTKTVDERLGQLEGLFGQMGFHEQKPDANFYRGQKNEFGQRHGIGRLEAPDGDAYFGEWVRDLRHGVGGVNFEGGELITSEWKFDQPHGFGEHQTPSGYHFMGEFKAGQPTGMGFVNYGDGTSYHGQFLEGQPHGYGIWQNGKYRYEGEFVAGVKEGRAKMISVADGSVVFTGRFKDDQPVKQ